MQREIIVTEFYDGQGLGNQLWLYVITRCKALDLGISFGIKSPEKFKGFSLFDLDFGEQVFGGEGPEGGPPAILPDGISHYFRENLVRHPITDQDVTSYSYEWNQIQPSTKLDGNFQGEKYIEKYKSEINEWLQIVAPEEIGGIDEDLCVINFRGGEYKSIRDVFLPEQYWQDARKRMLEINPRMKFKVVTDDEQAAAKFFHHSEISYQSMRDDYLAIYQARYLIIANTSFAWFPSWLNPNLELCIAPKYWWGYNTAEYWACGYNLTSTFTYLDKKGRLWSFEDCLAELGQFSFDNQRITMTLANEVYPDIQKDSDYFLTRSWKAYLKKVVPKSLIKSIRLIQSFIRRQRISFLNERIDPLSLFAPPLAESLSAHEGKIYDCFYFFNELDVLEIRLEILSKYVDKFVIFESNRTFSGNEKKSYYIENKDRFKRFEHQIIHYWLEDSPIDRESVTSKIHGQKSSRLLKTIAVRTLKSKNVPLGPGNSHWTIEAFQKESLHLAIEGFDDDDFVFISDVDEIWNPNSRVRLRAGAVYIFKQIPYMYKLNNRSNEHWHNWTGTTLARFREIKDSSINDMRTHGRIPRLRVLNGGWHFSFQTDVFGIREKLLSYGHQEINTPLVHAKLEESLEKNTDIRGRGAKYRKSDRGLPEFLLSNKGKFDHMFLD